MTNNDVLVINGKRYDATTGQPLGPSDHPIHQVRSVDGLSVPKKSEIQSAKNHMVNDKVLEPQVTTQPSITRRGHARDIILSKAVHRTSTSKPLMRRGVKKPSKTSNPYRQPETSIKTYKTSDITTHRNPAREQRAEKIHRSANVKHFSKHHYSESKLGVTMNTPTTPQARVIDTVATQTNRLQNIIDRGMEKATSHDHNNSSHVKRRHKKNRSKLKIFNISVVVIAVLLIIGFVIDKSIPDIDIHIASSRSGVHAELPGYVPSGFRFEGPIKYGQGIVTVIFTSGSKSFRVIQQSSSWDSVGLRDGFVTAADPHYTIVEAGGRIVYLYGQADATWVNGGVWYQITDNANFSTATLLRIVTSL